MSEYLLEVRFREMPRQHLSRLAKRLGTRLFEDLMGFGLGPAAVTTGRTSRRLTLCLTGLPGVSAEREQREIGPALDLAYDGGEATEALTGFAERVGAALEDLREIKTERGVYIGSVRQVPGRPLAEVLTRLVPGILEELEWWPAARGGELSGVLSLLDGEALPFEVFGTTAGADTVGHPILSPRAFEVTSFDDYLRRLRGLGVEVLAERRRRIIERALTQAAAELDSELVADDELLDQHIASCEMPGVLHGAFDPEHLELTEEILLATLGRRVGGFALRGPGGALLPAFLTVMDRTDDPGGAIRAGHERALDGGLVDARFNVDTDRRTTLAERLRQLDELDVHPELGSYGAKAERTRALVELVCQELGWNQVLEPAREAASLLKTDLTTRIVREFPSLRGTLGGIYAREEGYEDAICQSISEHYRVQPIPAERAGQVVAVADRLDTLVGFLSIDQVPSGGRDPFGLRRLTQGLLRIVIDAGLELDLDLVAARAVLLFGETLHRDTPSVRGPEQVLRELQSFLADRTRHLLGRRGFAYDEVEAAEAVGSNNLPDLVARLTALQTVREEPDFRSLVLSAKRISNIVQDAPEFELREQDLAPGAERALAEILGPVRKAVDAAAQARRYEDCLRAMARMVPELDQFFAEVLVMDENEELRRNRIALLQACRRVFWRMARLKEMAVEKPGGQPDGGRTGDRLWIPVCRIDAHEGD